MVGILCEKPSAKKYFAQALGGNKGNFEGTDYVLANSVGHIMNFPADPSKMVLPKNQARYKSWDMSNLPWSHTDMTFKKEVSKGKIDVMNEIKVTFKNCDEIVIATDVDESCEGSQIAWEIIDYLKLHDRKISRMYFYDEEVPTLQKAFRERKTLGFMTSDPEYKASNYRCVSDYMSMQYTRIALCASDGKSVLRQGRLKSPITVVVGDMMKAYSEYKKVPSYLNKFKDENGNIFSSPDEPTFSKADDVLRNYTDSEIEIKSKDLKVQGPPSFYDFSALCAVLSKKGISADELLKVYQNMYEDKVLSYPRTADKHITFEQYDSMLKYIDAIADCVGVDKSLLVVRNPRKTHVKVEGSHGANRPGTNVPSSLSAIKSKYGEIGALIYDTLARNFLTVFCEDYTYNSITAVLTLYPSFKSKIAIPQNLGFKQIFKDDFNEDEEDGNNKMFGKMATPFVAEIFPPRPKRPSVQTLMKYLEKYNVGTGATRVSTLNEMLKKDGRELLKSDKKGNLELTDLGMMSYHILPNTNIGSVKLTEELYEDMKKIYKGELDFDTAIIKTAKYVSEDIKTMVENGVYMRQNLGVKMDTANIVERVKGVFNGKEISIKREYSGYKFTDDEIKKLFDGETITCTELIKVKTGEKYGAKLSIQEYMYNDKKVIGPKVVEFLNNNNADKKDYIYGEFDGRRVGFKNEFSGHKFTQDEADKLFAGETVELSDCIKRETGKAFTKPINVKLGEKTYNGKTFIGIVFAN